MNKESKAFFGFHPIAAFIYLLGMAVATMFATNPIIIGVSLIGGILFCCMLQGRREIASDVVFYIPLFIILSVINPLFSHNGVTPLFFLNGNPVTLEAILYGIDIAAMMVSVMLWFKCFSTVMSSDKIIYLFGRIIPKLSLVLSMSLRFIPLFKRKWREIRNAQISMGYCSEKGLVSRIKSLARIFSALVGWALENAIDTSTSMKARGYGLRGRSRFSIFRFTLRDTFLLTCGLGLMSVVMSGMLFGYFDFSFYPKIGVIGFSVAEIIIYLFFGIFSLIPFILEVTEALRWKYLISKI